MAEKTGNAKMDQQMVSNFKIIYVYIFLFPSEYSFFPSEIPYFLSLLGYAPMI